MTINLSQPITLDQFKQLGRLVKSSRSLLIAVVSTLLIIFLGMQCYAIYGNYELYETKNADFLEISNQMKVTDKKLSKLVNGEAKYFSQLSLGPVNKSEMVDLLSNMADSSDLIVKKLVSNEGGQNKEKDGLVEMEFDGRYTSIQEFLVKIKPVLAASNVQVLKLEKTKESQYVHMTMNVKFAAPPTLKKVKASVAFNLKGADFYYDSFANWQLRQTGFVQVPGSSSEQQDKNPQEKGAVGVKPIDETSNQKRVDPFLPSPKSNQLDSASGSKKSTEAEGSMFLSGILYAKHKSICIVTLPSGESKVFEVGESLDGKRRITAIKTNAVTIRSNLDREYKVGQEIHVK